VERAFEFKEIPEDQKVKLVALKLRSFASLWWTNLLAKRFRQGKKKIRTWDKMKSKLKARFLPPTHLLKNYSQLHHLPTKTEPPKRELTKPLHKGSPSYPSKPVSPPQNEPSPDLVTPKEEEVLENVGEGDLFLLRRTLPETKEALKDGGVLLFLLETTPKAHSEDDKLENLRANSFLEGENDANMGTVLDQTKSNPSDQESRDLNQESKSLNQASKAKNGLFKAPQAVVLAVVCASLLFVFDPGKGQL